MKTFTVSRKRWHRGQGTSGSALRLEYGKQCCLGFLGQSCGIRAKDMLGISMPYHLEEELHNKFPQLGNIYYWANFSQINDDDEITDKEREQKLKDLAKANGFRFRFVP